MYQSVKPGQVPALVFTSVKPLNKIQRNQQTCYVKSCRRRVNQGIAIVRNAASVDAGASASSANDIKGEIVKPSLFNTPLVRGVSLVLLLLALSGGSGYMSTNWINFAHISAYGMWIGSMYFQTFIAGLTMFKNMPRQMFGKVQSKIFPQYFTGLLIFNSIVFNTMIFGYKLALNSQPVIVAGVALVSNLINFIAIEPKATDVLMERYALEASEEGRKDKEKIQQLYKEFSKLHGLSSLFNLVAFITAIAHGWWIGTNLLLA
eukprot:TRINITY_DN224_c0_g1_i2.p2 TRINITY_DN224_c0_g1~~TRINITY_DN224_c0_g1_i2.p2  ORF type:complete len:262 (-),score=14.06 TRINITY_DN224_c0_g1_i2:220-1005(-)